MFNGAGGDHLEEKDRHCQVAYEICFCGSYDYAAVTTRSSSITSPVSPASYISYKDSSTPSYQNLHLPPKNVIRCVLNLKKMHSSEHQGLIQRLLLLIFLSLIAF